MLIEPNGAFETLSTGCCDVNYMIKQYMQILKTDYLAILTIKSIMLK